MTFIFISYAHEDYEVARRLYDDLATAGLRPWLDKIDLLPGENWRHRIAEEIKTCKYFLALLSSRSLSKRGFVQQELRLALEILEEVAIDEQFLIPVRVDESHPKDARLAALQWVDLFPDYAAGLAKLLRSLRNSAGIPGRLYADVGIEIPLDISTWVDERLFRYIDDVLRPEAIHRAERDYEGIDVADHSRVIRERAIEKIQEVAARKGFLEAWQRYLERRNGLAT